MSRVFLSLGCGKCLLSTCLCLKWLGVDNGKKHLKNTGGVATFIRNTHVFIKIPNVVSVYCEQCGLLRYQYILVSDTTSLLFAMYESVSPFSFWQNSTVKLSRKVEEVSPCQKKWRLCYENRNKTGPILTRKLNLCLKKKNRKICPDPTSLAGKLLPQSQNVDQIQQSVATCICEDVM